MALALPVLPTEALAQVPLALNQTPEKAQAEARRSKAAVKHRSAAKGKEAKPTPAAVQEEPEDASPTEPGFYADAGVQGRASTRSSKSSAATFRALPYLGVGHSDIFAADTLDGAWLRAGKLGNVGFGPALTLDRYVTVPKTGDPKITDIFGSAKVGAFMNYQQAGLEWGRLTVSSGTPVLGSATGGLDIRATKAFSLGDGLSANFGPTLTFGDYKRLGLALPPSANGSRLAATGAALQIEKELGQNFTATMTANYALLHQTPNSSANLPGGRNRFDFGLALTRRFGSN